MTTNCRIKPKTKPTLNEFVQARPKYQQLDALKVVLLYDEYLQDNYGELAADQPELHIQDL